jgi:GNAT superfamily N-acetyltransferase
MPVVLEHSSVGRRVSVRRRRVGADTGPPYTDLVGELVRLDDLTATIRTRTGEQRITLADVVAARVVAASRAEVLDLERICTAGWRAAEILDCDGWLLRADHGWTSRANSALPLGRSRRSLDDQLADVRRFYSDRGLPAQIQVPSPGRDLLDAELERRGWRVLVTSLVLSAPLTERVTAAADAADRRRPAVPVTLSTAPDAAWQRGYHARDGVLSASALDLLARHDQVRFARVEADSDSVGIARGVVDEGWLGLFALEVAPSARRRGVAAALVGALASWGREAGAVRSYLQVEADNAPATAFWHSLGFTEHHAYRQRREPAAVRDD